jgi:hypothetical protein
MKNAERISAFEKSELLEVSKTLSAEDVRQLVEWLTDKDDKLRYNSLLLLQHRSESYDDVYPYWDLFCTLIKSSNSYHRSIGVMLIAENAKWDADDKMDKTIGDYLNILYDEKPITVRQCIQSLSKIVPCKIHLHERIAHELMAVNIAGVKETMRKLVLLDILNILVLIKKRRTTDEIDGYILKALTGGALDKKAIKQFEAML